ncbi:uncharacterized protein LOC126381898 [Pectinophora gossypiella]|uniref:uncharacterized protein LOC126381898 n=1 Tax=Pectinophora gossypiella TaxID=13191 RepID=UPI00214E0D34|nr:uncharacterized protein LOC126381898 [Pectinophora gossypiella]
MITAIVLLTFVSVAHGLCGASIRWSHNFYIDDVYGMWYGVGYAQHSPDMTNRPEDIGCVTLFITDADKPNDDLFQWSIPHRNLSGQSWLSRRNNPWSNTPMSGSWLDIRLKRRKRAVSKRERPKRVKRDMYEERRLRVVWDEDGQSMEQTYVYTPSEPGLWTVEQWRPMERELISHGVDVWYPDDPPRHPEVIRILKATQEMLIINHCSDSGGRGVFSLILRRSPDKVDYWEWYELQRQFYNYDLPNVHRKAAVCAACLPVFSFICFLICTVALKFL